MTQFLLIMGGFYANFAPMMGAFFAIRHGGRSHRRPHIRSKFPSEYPPPRVQEPVSELEGGQSPKWDAFHALFHGGTFLWSKTSVASKTVTCCEFSLRYSAWNMWWISCSRASFCTWQVDNKMCTKIQKLWFLKFFNQYIDQGSNSQFLLLPS